MFRHWKLTVAIVGVLALMGLGIGLAVGLSGVPAATLTISQKVHLEREITAPAVAAQASVVATEIRSQFELRGAPLLPAGSRLSIDGSTFHALSAQIATVDAVVSGHDVGRWRLVLVHEAGQWLLLGTRKLS